MKNVLMIIAQEIFRDEEYAHPKEVLEARGVTVTTASREVGACIGKLGMTATADIALADVQPLDYDAVAFIGGAGAATYFDDQTAHAVATALAEAGRPVAAICIAPSTLARAGLLQGVRATAFPSQREDLTAHGALWDDGPVVVDGLLITANGPDAARAFGEAIADALGA